MPSSVPAASIPFRSAGGDRLARTLTADLCELAGHEGEPVRISGWIHRRRRLSGLSFVIVRDRSGTAQVVVRDPAALSQIEELTEETTVDVVGLVSSNPQAPGGVELVEPVFSPLTDPAEHRPRRAVASDDVDQSPYAA